MSKTGGVSREAIVAALEDVWSSIAGLLDELTRADLGIDALRAGTIRLRSCIP